jgi:hypothetical protein
VGILTPLAEALIIPKPLPNADAAKSSTASVNTTFRLNSIGAGLTAWVCLWFMFFY